MDTGALERLLPVSLISLILLRSLTFPSQLRDSPRTSYANLFNLLTSRLRNNLPLLDLPRQLSQRRPHCSRTIPSRQAHLPYIPPCPPSNLPIPHPPLTPLLRPRHSSLPL